MKHEVGGIKVPCYIFTSLYELCHKILVISPGLEFCSKGVDLLMEGILCFKNVWGFFKGCSILTSEKLLMCT